MQSEGIARLQKKRSDLVVAAHLRVNLVEQGLLAVAGQSSDFHPRAGGAKSARLGEQGVLGKRVFEHDPGNGNAAAIAESQGDGDSFPNLDGIEVAVPLGVKILDPLTREIAAEQQHGQEDVHRIDQKAELGKPSRKPAGPTLQRTISFQLMVE